MADNLKDLLSFKNSTETTVHLYIYGDIVSDWWGAWSEMEQYPEAIKKFLDKANGREIIIHINSGGGNVFAGIAIYHMLKQYTGKKTAYIESLAGSISSLIPFAADKVIMCTGSVLMIHRPYFMLYGGYHSDDIRNYAETLDVLQNNITDIYCCHTQTNIERSVITDMINKETWLNCEEAQKYFKIEVENAPSVAAHTLPCTSEYIEKFALNKEIAAKYIKLEANGTEKINQIKPSDKSTATSEKHTASSGDQRVLLINKNNGKGEIKPMTMEELKEKYPELVAEIENNAKAEGQVLGKDEGAREERTRIKGIEDISASIGDTDMLNNAKYGENPLDAKELAFNFMKEQSKIGDIMLDKLKADAKDSNTDKVKPLGNAGIDDEADELKNAVSLIVGTK